MLDSSYHSSVEVPNYSNPHPQETSFIEMDYFENNLIARYEQNKMCMVKLRIMQVNRRNVCTMCH